MANQKNGENKDIPGIRVYRDEERPHRVVLEVTQGADTVVRSLSAKVASNLSGQLFTEGLKAALVSSLAKNGQKVDGE